MPLRPRRLLASLLLAPLAVPVLLSAPASAGALPSVTSGPRPGPDVLYAPPPRAPQLENTGPWQAPPLLVSGATAYVAGEWLYQDFLLDDHGATGTPDTTTPYDTGSFLFSAVQGTATYPTDPAFHHNAADLVELRVKPLADATAYRVTLNSLGPVHSTAVTLALGTGPSTPWPHGAGVSSPAAYFVTVHGTTAELINAATGAVVTPAPTVALDSERRQLEIRVPHAAWDPGRSTVRTTVGAGLWDPAAGRYLAPALGDATATRPGGGGPAGAALFNVGPRTAEPFPRVKGGGYTIADTAVIGTVDARWWREQAQARALALGDVSTFSAEVDFGRLTDGVTDRSGVPTTGPMDRVLATRFVDGQGLDTAAAKVCTDVSGGISSTSQCRGRFGGQLQPYAIYVPTKAAPATGYGLTLLLHSLSANYNQYADSVNQSQLGERGTGSIVITPNGRGPDGFYMGLTEADTFEVWADVARRYDLDPSYVAVSGYSMGGFGTYRLLARYPDLFARGFSVVGIPGTVDDQLASLRNTPIAAWNGQEDELVPVTQSEPAQQALAAAGLRYEARLFTTADHLTLAANDEFAPGVAFLGEHRVDRDPAHVTYVVDPREDNLEGAVVGDHAYWLGGLQIGAGGPTGTADVRSSGFGVGDAPVLGVSTGAGNLAGGFYPAMPYLQRTQTWGEAPTAPVADVLTVTSRNVTTMSIDVTRARVTCAVRLEVTTDVPLAVDLPGCDRTESFGGGPAPVVPEVPAAVLLPLTAMVLGGVVVVHRRRLG